MAEAKAGGTDLGTGCLILMVLGVISLTNPLGAFSSVTMRICPGWRPVMVISPLRSVVYLPLFVPMAAPSSSVTWNTAPVSGVLSVLCFRMVGEQSRLFQKVSDWPSSP